MGKLSSTSKLWGIQLEDVLVKNHITLYILLKIKTVINKWQEL